MVYRDNEDAHRCDAPADTWVQLFWARHPFLHRILLGAWLGIRALFWVALVVTAAYLACHVVGMGVYLLVFSDTPAGAPPPAMAGCLTILIVTVTLGSCYAAGNDRLRNDRLRKP